MKESSDDETLIAVALHFAFCILQLHFVVSDRGCDHRLLFSVYVDNILRQLSGGMFECLLGNMHLGCFIYADELF